MFAPGVDGALTYFGVFGQSFALQGPGHLAGTWSMGFNTGYGGGDRNATAPGAPTSADRVGSAVLLALTLPVAIVAAFAVLLTSPGPVIQRKAVIGADRRVVFIRRFRTTGRHGRAQRRAPVEEARSVTRVGWLLETSRIARLPALVDVWAGRIRLSDAIRG